MGGEEEKRLGREIAGRGGGNQIREGNDRHVPRRFAEKEYKEKKREPVAKKGASARFQKNWKKTSIRKSEEANKTDPGG